MTPTITSSSASNSKRQVASPQLQPEKRIRVRTGCLTCRRRRRKCDETRPSCKNCVGRGSECEWGIRATWREENAKSLGPEDQHSFDMVQPQLAGSMPEKSYQIVDLTSNISSHYDVKPQSNRRMSTLTVSNDKLVGDYDEDEDEDEGPTFNDKNDVASPDARDEGEASESTFVEADTPKEPKNGQIPDDEAFSSTMNVTGPSTSLPIREEYTAQDGSTHPPQTNSSPGYSATMRSPSYRNNYSPMSIDQGISPGGCSIDTATSASFAAIELMALSQQPPRIAPSRHGSLSHPHSTKTPATSIASPSSDTNSNSSAFVGTSNEELQNTLRHHIFLTTRTDIPTREGCPGVDTAGKVSSFSDPAIPPTIATSRKSLNVSRNRLDTALQRESVLLKNYLDEVAPWLDMFDNQRPFEYVIPILAKTAEHLKFSILALSARQLELSDSQKRQPGSESLSLYHQAISKLVPRLESKTNEVVASCVILCVLEMMSCSPQDWRRHLEGCAALIDSAGIHGHVGGLGQSLFWCFARMDVCGGIIAEESTIVPLGKWAGHPYLSLEDSVKQFQTLPSRDFDMWANYSVFLCAAILDLFASGDANRNNEVYRDRWRVLWRLLQDWQLNRPEEIYPLMTLPADPGDGTKPFPKILYGNAPAISGNQLYHTSSILLAQAKPKGEKLTAGSKSILWHARQVCGISATNTHHGCWSNALQPLWIAGRMMSHPSEHRVILDTLSRIEKETGWKMSWRADDLMEFWGCHD